MTSIANNGIIATILPSSTNSTFYNNNIINIANNLLELSRNDSPLFRTQLHRVEDALDDFSRWIDGILTTIKEHIDDVSRTMESLDRLCIVLGRIGFVPFLSEQRTGATVKTVLDLLSNTKELQDRMVKYHVSSFSFTCFFSLIVLFICTFFFFSLLLFLLFPLSSFNFDRSKTWEIH